MATLKDASSIHQIHTNAAKITCSAFYSEKQIQKWIENRTPNGYKGGISKKEIYVYDIENKVVAFSHIVKGEIIALFVNPSYQKRGIGKVLLSHGFEIATKETNVVTLEATPNAFHFYQNFGFQKISNSYTVRNGIKLEVINMEMKSRE
ncbi:GNAT family N-acetyltransferase [Bernardetia sp. ABR2-2B]|uniref:GNAT family N-acetyltransferase n=1 Tax=Bernardetia sp. ABR2-2B TaxID=3127472 RepID=UPI0030CAF831